MDDVHVFDYKFKDKELGTHALNLSMMHDFCWDVYVRKGTMKDGLLALVYMKDMVAAAVLYESTGSAEIVSQYVYPHTLPLLRRPAGVDPTRFAYLKKLALESYREVYLKLPY